MDCELLATAKITAVSLLLLTALWRICGSFLHRLFTRKLTVLYDLPEIGKARPDNKRIKGTAVICGGSIAGLFTARICADHFEDVLIIEPEAWLETKEGRTAVYDEKGAYIESRREHKRTRVEQYLRLHLEKKWILSAFLPVIIMALKHLAADFEENMRRSDGRIQDAQYNILAYGRYTMRLPTDGKPPQSLYASREAFERVLRGSIMKSSSRIRWMVGTVTGVETSPRDASRLSGVNVRTPSGTKGFIDAAFIADCSGPAQAGLKWLKRVYTELEKDASLAATLEHVSNALPFDKLTLNYSIAMRARKYRFYVPTEARARLPIPGGYENAGWIFATLPKPGELRSFIVDRIEGHRIELALSARGELDFPPHFADIKPFMRAVSATNPVPEWVFEMMDILLEYKDQVEDLGSEKSPSCYLTRYERAPYLPSNFAAIGDATMRVNPQYEQGCTKACIGAVALDGALRSPSVLNATAVPSGFGRAFVKLHTAKTISAWTGTKPTDYQWESTTPAQGEKLSDERFAGGLGQIMLQLSLTDDRVNSALYRVRFFLAPPTDLLHPAFVAKVLFFWVRQKFGLV
ncbi:hypothetical protein DFH11DRAFT_1506179 [Phellopilus nigrolimitatus]|nr:hypothetical protein DFH11DRAFT_1506179 [Phellopilus nigrolimitatus]